MRDRGVAQDACRCLVAQRVQARSLELGTGMAIISENVLLLDNPIRTFRYVAAQERHPLFDRLRLLLPLCRHSDVKTLFA
jgi:hypothetical protein